MYVAMNRFKVAKGSEEAFETVWRRRDSRLSETAGFVSFQLLKGPERDDHVLYCSHSVWESKAAFMGWMKSPSFRASHGDLGGVKPLYLGPPEFEGFEPVEGA